MSIVSGTIGAINQKKSADKATKTNLRMARETNNSNLVLDLARRGAALPSKVGGMDVPAGVAGKSSAILPYYLNDAEMKSADYASGIFDVLSDDLNANSVNDYRTMGERYREMFNQSGRTASGVFDGSLTNEELDAAAPVAAARIKLAGARKDAGLQALEDKLNEIKAIQGRRGFTGDTMGSQRLKLDATRKILGDAAVDASSAELANAMDVSGIKRNAIARRLANLNLPNDQFRREVQFSDLPSEAVRGRAESNISIFNPFRVNGGFQTMQRPGQVEPSPSTLGIVASQMAGTAQDVGGYLARRNWGGGGGGSPAGYSGAGWGYRPSVESANTYNNSGGATNFGGGADYGGGQPYSFDIETGI